MEATKQQEMGRQTGSWRHCIGHAPAEKKEKTLDRAGGLIRYAVLETDKGREERILASLFTFNFT